MNTVVSEQLNLLHETQALRNQMMDLLTDADLAYRLPGDNVSLGELCREMGEVEQSYIDSFKTFKQDFAYRHPDPSIAASVNRLREWFAALDVELDAALSAFSDADFESSMVDRGWKLPVRVQYHIYREALLIHAGKASIYLKALGKSLPEQWRHWIG